MPSNKETETAAAPTTSTTKGSAPTSIPKTTKDPSVGNINKKANGQKPVAAPSGFKFIFQDEMLQHLMLLNAWDSKGMIALSIKNHNRMTLMYNQK
jgi:hypothetical protein